MTAIQAVYVRGHEERSKPKPHTVFMIEIQAQVRSWQMWRRYSEFADLNTELVKSTGSPPPQPLPPKRPLFMLRSHSDEKKLEERRAGLELYLRAIISAKEDKWRDNLAFRDFLGVPVGKQGSAPASFTSASWLDEHLDLQSRVRDVRADVNKRDALSDRGDISDAHKANVAAKRKLAALVTRVGRLAEGLRELGFAGMSEGELQRRTDMVAWLQDDCEKLGKIVSIARLGSRSHGPPPGMTLAQRNPAPESDREALLGGPSTPITRVFGAAQTKLPQETNQTRPLDDQGLLQLQMMQMDEQDVHLTQLTTILRRQRQLGEAIGDEVKLQDEILDGLAQEVNTVGGKLSAAKTKLNWMG